jgi:hypothetical protein
MFKMEYVGATPGARMLPMTPLRADMFVVVNVSVNWSAAAGEGNAVAIAYANR